MFFASRAAFDSAWVNFEANEARYHQALNRIRKVIVVLLDDRLTESNFPEWMRRSIFLRSRAPSPIARIVRAAIDELVQDQQSSFFVGRASEMAAMQAALVPPGTAAHVSLVTVRGLPGIGRRTLLARAARDSLSFERVITVRIEPGETIQSLTMKLADLVEPIATPDDTLETAREIEALSQDAAEERFINCLKCAVGLHEIVALYDEGGLLDNDGLLTPDLLRILKIVSTRREVTVALITNRRPNWRATPEIIETPIVDVSPLSEPDVKQLLALTAKARGVEISEIDTARLIEQARGYPPAVRAIVQLVDTYGPSLARSAAQRSAQYQPRPLTRYLDSLKLDGHERRMLTILSRNSPLPIELLISFFDHSDAAVSALLNLIDSSLVVPQEGTSWYRISEPIIDYVEQRLPRCTIGDYRMVANGLEKFLAEDQENGQYLDLSRLFYRALVRAGDKAHPRAFALLSDWLRLAEEFYHQRDYDNAIKYATLAHESNPSNTALTWIVRCQVKLGSYDNALTGIEQLRRIGQVRESHFLRGFLERHRANYALAVKHYELAKHTGRGGIGLLRDLAECYFHTGDLDRASEYITSAQDRQHDNPFLINLRIKIACRQRDEKTARRLLSLLDQVDDSMFAEHRRSRVELTFGDVEIAYLHATQAVGKSERPAGEVLANLVICQIRTGRISEARQSLAQLESLYKNQRKDLITSLHVRLALAESQFEDAFGYCENFERTDDPVHIALRRNAIQGLVAHVSMPGNERRAKQELINELNSHLISRFGALDWEVEPE